jgi:hypothetical protein
MARVVTKIGDVFAVRLREDTCKYFWYVANDLTQLNCDVIRAFSKAYPVNANLDLTEVVRGEVDFHAHCSVSLGVKMGLWEKAGRVAEVGPVDVLFRHTHDLPWKRGEEVRVSHRWYVWNINEPFREVGDLTGANRVAEIGVVMSPPHLVWRLRTGQYGGVYPAYE